MLTDALFQAHLIFYNAVFEISVLYWIRLFLKCSAEIAFVFFSSTSAANLRSSTFCIFYVCRCIFI